MAEIIPDVQSVVEEAKNTFKQEFGEEAEIVVVAPGRVNLIGEHVDYNEGFVLPMALPLVTVMVGKKVPGDVVTILTTNPNADDPKKTSFEIPNERALIKKIPPGPPKWSNYVKGVISNFDNGDPLLIPILAFNAVIASTVPLGGGLSSSAALEVATFTFLEALMGCYQMPRQKAFMCQKAEHDYANVPCGIMDQLISVCGEKDAAQLIDCRYTTLTRIPFSHPDIVVVITNSNVKHELTGSEYSSRRAQCHEAALILKKLSLRDATEEDLDYLRSIDTDEVLLKRAKHVITEIKRTTDAAEALKSSDFETFGKLMLGSHESLRDDFEVSCAELDELVQLAMEVDGVLGSRMTGGGFGGCTVTLVRSNSVDKLISHIKSNYKGVPTFYVCTACDGAKILCQPD